MSSYGSPERPVIASLVISTSGLERTGGEKKKTQLPGWDRASAGSEGARVFLGFVSKLEKRSKGGEEGSKEGRKEREREGFLSSTESVIS